MDTNTNRDSDPFINETNSYETNFRTEGVVGDTSYRSSLDGAGRESWKGMAENLYHDMSLLWERQSMLIRTEMNEKFSDIKTAGGSLVTGGVLLFAGVFSLVATAIIALDLVLPLWASAVIVTAFLLIVGGIMLGAAKKKLEADKLKPTRSIETLGEISTTLKERFYEFKRH